MIAAILAEEFHPPSTKDFVFDCYFSVDLFGIEFCFNFIIALVVASVLIYLLLFLFAFRKPRTVPGKLQSLMELGLEFVREQIALPMLGPAADRFLPLLVTFFFFIFFMNMFEIGPVGELLGEQPRGVPARPRHDRLGHVQRRRASRSTGSSATSSSRASSRARRRSSATRS